MNTLYGCERPKEKPGEVQVDHMTPAEKQIINKVAERKGREWAEEHAKLIIAQAKLVGEL